MYRSRNAHSARIHALNVAPKIYIILASSYSHFVMTSNTCSLISLSLWSTQWNCVHVWVPQRKTLRNTTEKQNCLRRQIAFSLQRRIACCIRRRFNAVQWSTARSNRQKCPPENHRWHHITVSPVRGTWARRVSTSCLESHSLSAASARPGATTYDIINGYHVCFSVHVW